MTKKVAVIWVFVLFFDSTNGNHQRVMTIFFFLSQESSQISQKVKSGFPSVCRSGSKKLELDMEQQTGSK